MSGGWLKMDGLDKRFDGVKALTDFSCSRQDKAILGLIGPNGAGKTTLFNVVSGFLAPDRGEAVFRGTNLIGLPAHKVAATGIARTLTSGLISTVGVTTCAFAPAILGAATLTFSGKFARSGFPQDQARIGLPSVVANTSDPFGYSLVFL